MCSNEEGMPRERREDMLRDLDKLGKKYAEYSCAHEVCANSIIFFMTRLATFCDTFDDATLIFKDCHRIARKIHDEMIEEELKEIS